MKFGNRQKFRIFYRLSFYIYKTYFETIESKKASEVDLFNIGVNLRNKFNELFKEMEKIDYVIIENQIGPLAIRMKTIQQDHDRKNGNIRKRKHEHQRRRKKERR